MAAALLLGGLLVAAMGGVERLVAARHTAVPLVGEQPATSDAGWLLSVTTFGGLRASSLDTGDVRVLRDDDTAVRYSSTIASPSGGLIAIWQQPLDDSAPFIDIVRLTGERLRRLQWSEPNVQRAPSGWLNDDTLLLIRYPPFIDGESQASNHERAQRDTQLVAVDVRDGSERVLFQGDVSVAQAAPNGKWIAIRSNYDEQWYASTLELRPLDGNQLGAPTVRIEHRAGWGGVWSPDSAHYFPGVIVDPALAPRPAQSADSNSDSSYVPFQHMALQDIRSSGETTTLTLASARNAVAALAVAPDGQTLLFTEASSDCCGAPNTYWRLPVSGGDPAPYPIDVGAQVQGALQSLPADMPRHIGTLLSVSQPHYLNPDAQPQSASGFDSTGILMMQQIILFDGGPQPRVLSTSVSGLGGQFVGWLPAGSLAPPPAGAAADGNLSAPEPVSEIDAQLRVTQASSASPDGRQVILYDTEHDGPVLWASDGRRAQPAPTIAQDLSWADTGAGVISATGSNSAGSNWIGYTTVPPAGAVGGGGQLVDPDDIHANTARHYARPVVSPLGNRTAYFIVDASTGEVELHVADSQWTSRVVAHWQTPAGALLDPPLLAFWPTENTLVFVQPDNWADGLPGRAHLLRVTFAPDGAFTGTTLMTLRTRGNEHGIIMQELALSPDKTQFAYRLRHYDQRTADSGRHDTLHVSDVSDVSRAFELARDLPGDGLVWSPDSLWLAAALHGRIALLSADGHAQRFVTDEVMRAAFPVWLANRQLWFAVDTVEGPHVWRVTVW